MENKIECDKMKDCFAQKLHKEDKHLVYISSFGPSLNRKGLMGLSSLDVCATAVNWND